MEKDVYRNIEDLPTDDIIRLIGIYAGEALVHYGLWFANTVHGNDMCTALDAEAVVLEKYGSAALKRLAPHFGLQLTDHIPTMIKEKTREELVALLQDIAKTWLASDGIWFQELESRLGMVRAKIVNDTCWSAFGPMEAFKLKRLLGIDDRSGLEGLARILPFRLYSSMNAFTVRWEDDRTLIWEMNECRVQTARRRKGLDDYPCKSAGIAEYTSFALGTDARLSTQCVYCAPDPLPDGSFCAWRFTVNDTTASGCPR